MTGNSKTTSFTNAEPIHEIQDLKPNSNGQDKSHSAPPKDYFSLLVLVFDTARFCAANLGASLHPAWKCSKPFQGTKNGDLADRQFAGEV
jgi:hypothetical protein